MSGDADNHSYAAAVLGNKLPETAAKLLVRLSAECGGHKSGDAAPAKGHF